MTDDLDQLKAALLQQVSAKLAKLTTQKLAKMIDQVPLLDNDDKVAVMMNTTQTMLEAMVSTWVGGDEPADQQLQAKLEYCRIFRRYVIQTHNTRLKETES